MEVDSVAAHVQVFATGPETAGSELQLHQLLNTLILRKLLGLQGNERMRPRDSRTDNAQVVAGGQAGGVFSTYTNPRTLSGSGVILVGSAYRGRAANRLIVETPSPFPQNSTDASLLHRSDPARAVPRSASGKRCSSRWL